MKYLICLLLVISVVAQQVTGDSKFATILPNIRGEIIQYAFPVSPFVPGWLATGHQKKFTFYGTDVEEMQTVNGVTELYLEDSHDICGVEVEEIFRDRLIKGKHIFPLPAPRQQEATGSCSFIGTKVQNLIITTSIDPEGANYQHVVAYFIGTFNDAKGDVYDNVLGILSFDIFPNTDGAQMPSAGSVVIVLGNN